MKYFFSIICILVCFASAWMVDAKTPESRDTLQLRMKHMSQERPLRALSEKRIPALIRDGEEKRSQGKPLLTEEQREELVALRKEGDPALVEEQLEDWGIEMPKRAPAQFFRKAREEARPSFLGIRNIFHRFFMKTQEREA